MKKAMAKKTFSKKLQKGKKNGQKKTLAGPNILPPTLGGKMLGPRL